MAQEIANNTFTGGMVLDINEIDSPSNTYCSNALNATVATSNGNEGAIQNEMGNVEIVNGNTKAHFPNKAVVLGSAEYGGIIYYVLYYQNEEGKIVNAIGSFPSPDYSKTENNEYINEEGKLIWDYQPLHVIINNGIDKSSLEYDMGYSPKNAVNILVEPSFDGSVNLILNDGVKEPRLINTAFQVKDNYEYKHIQRYSTNNTNSYDTSNEKIFNLQTSLYRNFSKLSKFEYNGTINGGDLKVGTYVFYAVACDKDGNESDIICESGPISVFIGEDGDPFSVNGGEGNQNSYKTISITVKNVDNAYKYIKLYYSRTTAQNDQLPETSIYKVNYLYELTENEGSNEVNILFTGKESQEQVDNLDTQYFLASSAKAQALSQNMLFLANLSTQKVEDSDEFERLRDFSCHIRPVFEILEHDKFNLKEDYTYEGQDNKNSYYSSKYIYEYTGYHANEYYRFGIVYIRKDGSLTNVFNTLGYINNPTNPIPKFDYTTNNIEYKDGYNNYGIVKSINCGIFDIIGVRFELQSEESSILDNYKGYFFVRQKRIPTILAQGYVTNVCEESYVPSINIPLKNKDGVTEDNGKKQYLYESFVYGHSKIAPTLNTYPQFANSKNGTFTLRNEYKRRLFSLTDECYAFFDRLSSNDSVFGAFYDYVNGEITDVEIGSSTRYTIYGGDSDDTYLTFYNNNATPDGSTAVHAKSYKADFIYFVKVQLINSSYDKTDLVKLEKSDDSNQFAGFRLYDDREIYKDSNNNYYLLLNDDEYNNQGYPKLIDGGKYYLTSSDNGTINKLKSNYLENVDEVFIDENHYIGENVPTNNDAFKVYQGNEYTWDYADDTIIPSVCCNADYYSKSFITVQLKPVGDNRLLCPKWVSIEGNYYTYVAFGPAWSIDSNPGIKNATIATLSEYIKRYKNSSYNKSGLDTSKEAWDLTIPTFNGKYGYTSDISRISDVGFMWNPIEQHAYAIFCPEFELDLPYYNNFFTGGKMKIQPISKKQYLEVSEKPRLYLYKAEQLDQTDQLYNSNLISVKENVSLVAVQYDGEPTYDNYHLIHKNNVFFSTKAGNASEVGFKFAGAEFLASTGTYDNQSPLIPERPFNIVRGIYGSYVGAYCSEKDISDTIVNIYAPNYNEELHVKNIANDSSPYYPISDRISVGDEPSVWYRGDCYIGFFTHRINRNFQDPTSPYNDNIIDSRSFANGFNDCFSVEYRTFDTTKDGANKFNLGDLNAIQLGSWVTFPVRSTKNISLRAIDKSQVDEKLLCGNDRSFYPVHPIDVSGSYKIPESDCYNMGFNKSVGDKHFFNLNQLVYNKVYYKNRVVYSNVLQSSALNNGNRVFLAGNYRDYTEQYGEITKLIDINGNILVVCEHGILLLPINERALVSESVGGPIVVNNTNVLPENPKIISDTYGSQWEESVVNTPYGIYGVDSCNRKIWYTDGNSLKTISDFKVQEFLNNYLEVSNEKEINKCNIKTHYVKYKNDVLFTLYDVDNAVYWNLCWNINEENFKTFYSWIPQDSQNIGNNLISVPLPELLKEEHDHSLEIGNNIKIGEVTKYSSDGIICNKPEVHGQTYLWKHGQASIVPSTKQIQPTNFYGHQHPFEFEFIVKDNPDMHKIFDNLQIISNKAAPESFHYEIVGECYDFGKLKKTAYIRQEALKKLYNDSFEGNIKYDKCENENVEYDKSNYGRAVIFPLYYKRVDKPNLIYDEYKNMFAKDYNYDNLSGTEIIHYPKLNEYRLINHVKAVDVHDKGGLLRGNMQYKEDKWCVQINPINYVVGNEPEITWKNDKPPILLSNIKLDKKYDGQKLYIPNDVNIYARWKISERKEVNVKDKFIKIKIRYTGNELAIISAIKTLYRISYA